MQSLINDQYVIIGIGSGTRITAAELSEMAYHVCMSPLQLLESMESFAEFVASSIDCIREYYFEKPLRSRFVVPKRIAPTVSPLMLRHIRPYARSTC